MPLTWGNRTEHRYELEAIVEHLGGGVSKAHYVAHVRTGFNRGVRAWVECNDGAVRKAANLERALDRGYMYVYRRAATHA